MTTGSDRPDPLEPPGGYGRLPPADRAGKAELAGICADLIDGHGSHCPMEVTEVWTIGCAAAEHVGPLEYCSIHAAKAIRAGPFAMVCGQCVKLGAHARIRVLNRTRPDGSPLGSPWAVGSDTDAEWALRQVWPDG
jgi:hypothetical protein